MPQLLRALRRWDGLRVVSAALGAAFAAMLLAFIFAAVSVRPGVDEIVAAVALLGIAGAGFLYAWRDPGR